MKAVMLAAAAATPDLNLNTGIPAAILVPLIVVIAIAAVVGIMWLYKKLNKNKAKQ